MNKAIEPVGIIKSCFKQKFGIPRQSGLVPLANATLELVGEYNRPEMVNGLDSFSHIWLFFGFHEIPEKSWKPVVRPPRLGGNKRVGVFASRSMFRPNGLGLSVCKLEFVDIDSKAVTLGLSAVDLLDKTPVFDIKPYLPYADAISDAQGGYAVERPLVLDDVIFSDLAASQCHALQEDKRPDLVTLISQILAQDPRPAYHQDDKKEYGMLLYDLEVKWRVVQKKVYVVKVLTLC